MAQVGKIRVMLVDDHAAVRDGFTAFLEAFDDLTLIATASGGVEALYFCSWFQPDVVLMDLMTTNPDGITATRLIRQLYSNTQVIALTDFEDQALIDSALAAGAVSFLHKGAPAIELVCAIRAAVPTIAAACTLKHMAASLTEVNHSNQPGGQTSTTKNQP